MEDEVEFSAKTVEDAIVQAEGRFGTSRRDLGIQILSQGRSGVFGIGAEPARIRVRPPQPPATVAPEPVLATPTMPDVYSAGQTHETNEHEDDFDDEDDVEGTPSVNGGSSASSQTMVQAKSDVDLPSEASTVLLGLLQSMGFDVEVHVRSTENPVILAVTGENLGMLIGRRGDNLSSLQFMVNLILSKHRRQWPRVVIDVENYRARREESLRSLADRIAYRVRRGGRPFTLEAMPASDRRIIHLALRERPEVETYSIGEGATRRVVIAPTRDDAPRFDDGDEE